MNQQNTYENRTGTPDEQLKLAQERFNIIFQNTTVSIWDYIFETKQIIQPSRSQELHGFDTVVENVPDSLIESGFIHPDSVQAFREMYDRLLAGEEYAEGIFRVQTADRLGYWYEHIRYHALFDENGKPYAAVGMSTDDTDEIILQQKADSDALTGLLNKTAFRERMKSIFSRYPEQTHILLNIDLDDFKQINDSYSHAAGDEVLRCVGQLIVERAAKLSKTVFVSRAGGDEFMVLLCDTSESVAVSLAQTLLDRMKEPLTEGICTHGSIGIAVYPEDGETPERLELAADRALYSVKHLNKNSYCFYGDNRANSFLQVQRRQQFLSDTISGGMIGGYREPGFPFYFVDHALLSWLGYDCEEEFITDIEGLVENGIHPDDRSYVTSEVNHQLALADRYTVDYRMRKKDGSYIWVHDVGEKMLTEDGRQAITSVCYDISAEKERDKLESYFQTLVENLPGGIAVVSGGKDGVLKPEYITENFAAMTGMTRDQVWDLYERDALAGVHPEDHDRILNQISEFLATGQERCELIYRLIRGDGTYFWVKNTMSLIRYGKDQYYIYATYRDITEERKKQENLREQYYELLRRHYQTRTPETLILGHCNISNQKIYEIKDYTSLHLSDVHEKQRDAFFEKLSEAIVDEGERSEFLHHFLSDSALEAFHQGKNQMAQECFMRIPGEKRGRYVLVDMAMVATPDSEDVTGILTVTDVTEKKMQKKMLYDASVLNCDFVVNLDLTEDRYTILSRRENADYVPPTSGSHTRRMQYMSENVIATEDVPTYCRELEAEHILKRLKEEGPYSFAFTICEENRVLVKRIAVSPVDLKIGRVCLVRTDITALMEKERESKEAIEQALEEARKANQAKSDFLSRMSHDIRTPLNGVIGMSEIALRENRDPKIQPELETIASSGHFLLSLINDILDISRIESGKMELHPAPMLLTSFDHTIDAVIRPQMREKNITFEYRMECGLSCAMLDEVRFNQVFFNLLSNAAKFTPENGHVIFSARELSSDDRIEWVRFSVKDNGIGMSRESLARIFEPFEQLDQDRKLTQQTQGSGLGLAIVREIVAMMGGRISVESEPGKGSEFLVDLPLEKCPLPEPTAESQQDPSDAQLAGKHVLLAEDNEINRLVAFHLLENKGIKVSHAENGQVAVAQFSDSPVGTYDAILMDIRMPVMDGLEATRRIRSLDRPDAQTVPIIAMSANAYEEDQKLSLEAGMNAHLSKPIEVQALYRILTEV